jgi:hypothetical protein
MIMSANQQPLSNVQLELLKLYATNMSDEDVLELRDVLARHFMKKAVAAADRIWEERGYTNELMEQWHNEEDQ